MLKKILTYPFEITKKQAIYLIFAMACFLNVVTFTILQHNGFYSYLNEDVACIIDMSKSFETEYELVNEISNGNWERATNLLKTYWKPPAYFVFSAPILLIINNINLFLSILNFFLCFLTLLFVYGIVKNLYSIKAGLIAVFILSFCPLFFVIHRTFFIETILATSICIVLYIITKNKLDNPYWNILFTLSLIFALLTKEQIFIFYPAFLLFILANKENYKSSKRIINIIISFFCSYVVAYFIWYGNNAPNIFRHLLYYAKDMNNCDFFYYIKSFYYFDLSPFVFILLVLSIIYLLFNRKHLYILISFLFVLFIFSLSTNKVSRHVFPVIIFCPILIALFLFQIKNTFIKRSLIFIICFVLLSQFILINFFHIKYFTSGNFYGYNYFKSVTYYDYKSEIQTYKQQYEYLKDLLGNEFENDTIFINFFPTQAYNFLIFQGNRKHKTCNIFTYYDVYKTNLTRYKNIIISSKDEQEYNKIAEQLLNNNYELVGVVDIYNHTDAKTFLYKKK